MTPEAYRLRWLCRAVADAAGDAWTEADIAARMATNAPEAAAECIADTVAELRAALLDAEAGPLWCVGDRVRLTFADGSEVRTLTERDADEMNAGENPVRPWRLTAPPEKVSL